ncbi:MAG TPA: Stf0 family sulfotransferase [Casimicrobiaceae bacterium]|nr:Stf0 family sulfotransferase [Casimicrobiaceae bacterium]
MHHDELDRAEWDRPRPDGPVRRVLICSTPRSGSYLLCRQMINAGLGLPTEYLRKQTRTTLRTRWGTGVPGDLGYLDAVEEHRTTGNGVFGAKLQWRQCEQHPVTRERWLARADLVVFLVRDDLAAQAVSWQISLATGLWSFDHTRGPTESQVSLESSDVTLRLAGMLRQQNENWAALLAGLGRPVLAVHYERYVAAQGELLAEIAARLGLRPDEWTMPPPEGRDNRLPAEVEEARVRLLAHVRGAAGGAGAR